MRKFNYKSTFDFDTIEFDYVDADGIGYYKPLVLSKIFLIDIRNFYRLLSPDKQCQPFRHIRIRVNNHVRVYIRADNARRVFDALNNQDLATVTELARLLGVHVSRFSHLLKASKASGHAFRCLKIGSKNYYSKRDIELYFRNHFIKTKNRSLL